jgi:hypothetical protein
MFKRKLKAVVQISSIFVLAACLSACFRSNPILKVDPNVFATDVNGFAFMDMGEVNLSSCAIFYINQNKSDSSLRPMLATECPKYFARFLGRITALPFDQKYKGATLKDLTSKETWEHYAKSEIARKDIKEAL